MFYRGSNTKMIQPCIALIPHQADQVAKLVRHCRDLDGTELKVIPVDDSKFTPLYKNNELACRCAWALRTVAMEMKGKPFLWLEPDSYPIKKGWLKALTEEYEQAGKPFMLPIVRNGAHDLASGIGIYPGETHFLVPTDFAMWGWDHFVYNQLTPLIHFTDLIYHRYGTYFPDTHQRRGHVQHYMRFPRDKHMIPERAVLVHKDANGTLSIGHENTFFSNGDIGDCVAALPVMRQLGGGHIIIGDSIVHVQKPRESMRGRRFDVTAPLLAAQPYIKSVTWGQCPKNVDFDFSSFRQDYRHGENLAAWQARHVGIDHLDESKWISVPLTAEARGRVVIARSPRYHNEKFPWRKVLQQYGAKLLFVGLREEHDGFQNEFKCRVEYRQTQDLLHVAKLIAGADLFIGNQSSPAWIAMGLAQNLVMEVWPTHPNSTVKRDNAKFVFEERQY
jgi:hypothetical protein